MWTKFHLQKLLMLMNNTILTVSRHDILRPLSIYLRKKTKSARGTKYHKQCITLHEKCNSLCNRMYIYWLRWYDANISNSWGTQLYLEAPTWDELPTNIRAHSAPLDAFYLSNGGRTHPGFRLPTPTIRGGYGTLTRTLVPWRQGFRHPTREQVWGLFHPKPIKGVAKNKIK